MPRFLSGTPPSGIFRQQQQPPTCKNDMWCSATSAASGWLSIASRGDKEKNLLVLTNVVAWLSLLILGVWQMKKRRQQQKKRRQSQQQRRDSSSSLFSHSPPPPLMTESHSESSNYSSVHHQQQQQQQLLREHESLISALQEELHEKSVAENEQAILWRQEKRIFQSRINELLQQQGPSTTSVTSAATTAGDNSSRQNHEAQLLQQVKDMQETIAFLTSLTESQTVELENKKNEINKLNNILDELQQHMGGKMASSSSFSPRTVGTTATETATTTTDDEEDDDDDDDGVSIDSSVDVDDVNEAGGAGKKDDDDDTKSKLQEGNKVVLLVSTMPGNLSTSVHQSRLESIFKHGLQLHSRFVETVDGCDSDLTLLRNDLFQISGMHAVYPQVFLVRDDEIEFVGDFDTVQELHDIRELPQRIGLLLPGDKNENGEEDEKENTKNNKHNKYGNLGAVLLDTNTDSIAVS